MFNSMKMCAVLVKNTIMKLSRKDHSIQKQKASAPGRQGGRSKSITHTQATPTQHLPVGIPPQRGVNSKAEKGRRKEKQPSMR